MIIGVAPHGLTPIGSPYCTSNPNSTGSAATISAFGTTSVAANHLLLTAAPMLNDGTAAAQTPLGSGFICVGGSTFRLPVIGSDGAGILSFPLDLNDLPGGPGQITAGSTWYFAAWFRDVQATPPFNLSDGVAITFGP